MKTFLRSSLLLALAWSAPSASRALAQELPPGHPPTGPVADASVGSEDPSIPHVRKLPWSERALELAGSLPVQDLGRVKPLSTLARFALLKLSGKKSLTTPADEKLEPTAWLLDVILVPEQAATYPTFLVQDVEAARAIGLDTTGKKKRDRWSYDEILPGVQTLFQKGAEYSRIEAKERDSVEQNVVLLADNVHDFLSLAHLDTLALVPPATSVEAQPTWETVNETYARSQQGRIDPDQAAILLAMDRLQRGVDQPAEVEGALEQMSAASARLAEPRGETEKIALERFYYGAGLLGWSQVLFLGAFVVSCLLWLRPRSKVVYGLTSLLVAAAAACLIGAIVLRCMIRGRPPVSTLYETLLFVTAVGSLVALGTEAIYKRRVAISTAAFLGMVGLFLANGYETLDKKDTMPELVAVLDTNFWLSTHVTSITIGYSAGMLAALLANVYLLSKTFGIKRGDRAWYGSLARMVYGVLAFSLIFSIVGTILGGVWANESWGRFWGWDPKENGALLICLTQIAILHGRMGGYLREHGLCTAVALGGNVIAFSWFGVNLLGVGLHSYGFTSGIHTALLTYYGIQTGIALVGGLGYVRERSFRRELAARNAADAAPPRREPSRARPSHGGVEPA